MSENIDRAQIKALGETAASDNRDEATKWLLDEVWERGEPFAVEVFNAMVRNALCEAPKPQNGRVIANNLARGVPEIYAAWAMWVWPPYLPDIDGWLYEITRKDVIMPIGAVISTEVDNHVIWCRRDLPSDHEDKMNKTGAKSKVPLVWINPLRGGLTLEPWGWK